MRIMHKAAKYKLLIFLFIIIFISFFIWYKSLVFSGVLFLFFCVCPKLLIYFDKKIMEHMQDRSFAKFITEKLRKETITELFFEGSYEPEFKFSMLNVSTGSPDIDFECELLMYFLIVMIASLFIWYKKLLVYWALFVYYVYCKLSEYTIKKIVEYSEDPVFLKMFFEEMKKRITEYRYKGHYEPEFSYIDSYMGNPDVWIILKFLFLQYLAYNPDIILLYECFLLGTLVLSSIVLVVFFILEYFSNRRNK